MTGHVVFPIQSEIHGDGQEGGMGEYTDRYSNESIDQSSWLHHNSRLPVGIWNSIALPSFGLQQ